MAEKVLVKGNEAVAEAAILSGCRYFFGYPITPQTEISAYMAKRMPKQAVYFYRLKVKYQLQIWFTVLPAQAQEL